MDWRVKNPPKPEPRPAFLRSMMIYDDVLQKIERTIGQRPAEQGGALIGYPETGIITDFLYDKEARSTGVIYEPNFTYLNEQIERFAPQGKDVLGIVHSHPPGFVQPSSGDNRAAYSNITSPGNPHCLGWFMPIVQTKPDVGCFEFHPYIATCDQSSPGHCRLHKPALRILRSPSDRDARPRLMPLTEKYARVAGDVDFAAMARTTLIVVGTGAGGLLVEQFARLGVKRFILFDLDVVEEKNLAAQDFVRSDIGELKTKALRRRLRAIEFEQGNPAMPAIEIDCHGDFLGMTDEEYAQIVEQERSEGQIVISLFLSDAHPVQARGATLAIRHRLPAFWVGVYRGGGAAELIFWHPEPSDLPCYRCITSSRYEHHERMPRGQRRAAVSSGLPFSTTMIDAVCGLLVVGAIHRGDHTNPHARLYERLLQERRNFVQLQTNPDYRMGGEDIFAGVQGSDVVTFVTMFQADGKKYGCPDCGSPNLFASRFAAE